MHFKKRKYETLSFFNVLFFTIIISGCFLFSQNVFAYSAYTPNADLVKVNNYGISIASSDTPWGAGSTRTLIDNIVLGHKYQIRQDGTVSQVKFYWGNTGGITGLYVKIWRKNGSNYDLVGESNNIISSITQSSTNTINLSTPITGVKEGDYVGFFIEKTLGTNDYPLVAINDDKGGDSYEHAQMYYTVTAEATGTNYNWSGQLSSPSYAVPVEVYMQAPQVVGIGDSIMAGGNLHRAYLVDNNTHDAPATSILAHFKTVTGYTYQNMGIGSQPSSSVNSRFTTDVLNLKPRVVIIEVGVNDIALDVQKSTFISNYTAMLDAAQANSGVATILVVKILPWTAGTNAQMQTRDDWNASLVTLAEGYSKAVVVDANSYVGKFRAGGDAGNLWDIQTSPDYDDDGVHFTEAGHTQIAQAIADALDSTAPTTTASVDSGIYNVAQSVTLTCDDGNGQGCDEIYYTTNGDDPTTGSSTYSVPINISSSTTLKYFSQDVVGNQESIKTKNYTIDNTPPTITITNPNTFPAQSKTITATATESATMSYAINNSGVNTCDGSLSFTAYTSLTFSSEGDNGKKVCYKAQDSAANITYSLSNAISGIDTTGPTTTIDSHPDNSTTETSATFTFSASENATFQCKLDSSDYATCVSPQDYASLPIGEHTFSVKATDEFSNEGSPVEYVWTITTPIATPAENPTDNHHGVAYNKYQNLKKEYNNPKNKTLYTQIKKTKTTNPQLFLKMKSFYNQYKKLSKRERKALTLQTQELFNKYRSYNGYKQYKAYKAKY